MATDTQTLRQLVDPATTAALSATGIGGTLATVADAIQGMDLADRPLMEELYLTCRTLYMGFVDKVQRTGVGEAEVDHVRAAWTRLVAVANAYYGIR